MPFEKIQPPNEPELKPISAEQPEKPVEIENPDIGGLAFKFKPDEIEGVLRRLVPNESDRRNLSPDEREKLISEEEIRVKMRQARASIEQDKPKTK